MDAFAELEQLDAANPSPDSRPPKRKPETENTADKPVAKPEPKAVEKQPEKAGKQPQDKPKDDGEVKDPLEAGKASEGDKLASDDPTKPFQMASDLRKAYRTLHQEHEKLVAELKQARNGKPEPTEERKLIETKLSTLEKRNKELEEEISYHDYTKSEAFDKNFKKPFEKKLARVYSQITDLRVKMLDENGEETGQERPANQEDFDKVLESPNNMARELAKKMFGEDFRDVLQFRRELNELQQNADTEAKSWREKAEERKQTQAIEQRKQMEQAQGMFRKVTDNYVEKYPEWFGKVEDDDEINKALESGFAAVDKTQDPSVPYEQRLDMLAASRLKAASFGRHVITIKRLKAENAELKESLKAYQKSEPGEGQGQRTASVPKSGEDDGESAFDEIDKIERRNPVAR